MHPQQEIRTFHNHIDGQEAAALSGAEFVTTNPTTGARWGRFPLSGAADVALAASAAQRALQGAWGTLSPTRRGRLMMRWADLVADAADELAALDTAQGGKLFSEVRAQIRAMQDWLYYFGGLADKIEGAVIPLTQTTVLNYTLREPLGVVGVIVPWNSPVFLTIMSVAPILAAGNTIVIKPSEVTSASATRLAALALQAGMPAGVVNVVNGMREAGEALVDHPAVAKICFTGSDAAGRLIAARAGGRLASCTLELGGKSPNIVFADADPDLAEAGVLAGIFAAAGQTCIAGSRAYIHESLYDRLVGRLVERANAIVLGDPMLGATQMGPVATAAQLDKDIGMVARAVAEGAHVLCGGRRAAVAGLPLGNFFQPTIIENAAHGSFLMQNEVFGPVLSVTPFADDEDVLAMANGTAFGLGAGIWTRDLRRAHVMARRLCAGTVWVNTYRAMACNSPFGGMKDSGIGRQNGMESVFQYLKTKSVWCELGTQLTDPFVMRV
ncbi:MULTISPECIES: aldehyde dehydrogenase [Cupriavidus]